MFKKDLNLFISTVGFPYVISSPLTWSSYLVRAKNDMDNIEKRKLSPW